MTSGNYLQGSFGPVHEELTVTELPVTGTIPDHLDGRYVRNGPNPLPDPAPDPATYHWFLGHGMVHGVRLRDGRAEWYRNRWVRNAEVARALGEEPPPGPTHAGMDFAANTHVVGHAGRTFAVVEAGSRPVELTDELDTVGPCDFDGTLPGGYTAHPHRDPATGELHAVSYWWGWGNRVQYSVLGPDARIRRTVDIEVAGPTMMHDFSLTARHVVLYDLPVTFDVEKAAQGTLPYTWNPDHPARVGLLPRDSVDGGDVRWFEIEPCYVYHPLNAYDEDDGRVVLDVVRHPSTFRTDHNGPWEGPPALHRWTVDPAEGKVVEELLDGHGQEFPRIDERRTGHRHRYGYVVGLPPEGERPYADTGLAATSIIRHDLVAGTRQQRDFGPGTEPGEFVFVPAGDDAAEDEGVLMGYVYD
ncbi:MAG TPA: carotenoid oxygenase family protein, partial [Acidimicrobiales bacterium]